MWNCYVKFMFFYAMYKPSMIRSTWILSCSIIQQQLSNSSWVAIVNKRLHTFEDRADSSYLVAGKQTLTSILLSSFYTSIKVNKEGAKRFARETGVFITSRYPMRAL